MMRAWLLAGCLAAGGIAVAAPPGARSTACEPLGSAARQEPLSQLLKQLRQVRRVRIENWSAEDPIVWHAGGSDVELIAALAGQVNLLVRYTAARECPGKWRVAAIWVLPRERGPVVANLPATALPSTPTASERAVRDLYLQGHGGNAGPQSP